MGKIVFGLAVMVAASGGCAATKHASTSTTAVGATKSGVPATLPDATTPAGPPTSLAKKSSSYTLGQTAASGGYNFTVFAVQDPYTSTNEFETATAGDRYVTVDVQVTNPSSKTQAFSSLISFHLLDSLNHQYDEELLAGVPAPAPDGEIGPKASIRGFAAFEIPAAATGLRFRAQGSLTSTGAEWVL